jgi:hypothetical protein
VSATQRALIALLVIVPALSAQSATKSLPSAAQGTGRAPAKGVGYAGIDSVQLIADLSALSADSMDGRRIGTAGNIRARAYILRQFLAASLSPFAQRFTFSFTAVRAGGTTTGTNLVGYREGTKHPERFIVLSAHYDHLGNKNGAIYNGADDNASGTAGVLAIARWLKEHPPENSVIFALFDGEEQGLLGAKEFIARPPVPLDKIVANVNLDMVGRNAKGELWAAGATSWPVMRPILEGLIPTAPVTLKLGHDSGTGQDNWTQQSDQGPFHTARIPWVYFGVEDHPDYHQPSDKFAKIEPGFFVCSVRTIAEFVHRLDEGLEPVVSAKTRSPAGK